jgi:hypothetical protein
MDKNVRDTAEKLFSSEYEKLTAQEKPLQETHFLRGANEIHKCRLVFLKLESII